MKQKFQLATIQLDFQPPERFELSYSTEDDGKLAMPVMIHRAILGSFERMFAILIERYKGKWPFWLSPRQVIVCPVSIKSQAYELHVWKAIRKARYYVDIDTSDRSIQKKRTNQTSMTLVRSVATEPAPKSVEESKMDSPKEIFLKDYKLPDYYFDTVDLSFTLGEEKTIVSAKISVVPRKQLCLQKFRLQKS